MTLLLMGLPLYFLSRRGKKSVTVGIMVSSLGELHLPLYLERLGVIFGDHKLMGIEPINGDRKEGLLEQCF